ncbi:hypothetical protein RYH80_01715 [Halobaculum sp. MBLA0147]|uniref:DUF7535 family protein n=1 Tax=Halobaculum sp. MBLA0147 TaxID=3079934 RepID=UPI003526306F
MSHADDTPVPEPLKRVVRSVTPPQVSRGNSQMDTIGWGYLAILAVMLIPFLPFLVLAWLASKLFAALDPREGDD